MTFSGPSVSFVLQLYPLLRTTDITYEIRLDYEAMLYGVLSVTACLLLKQCNLFLHSGCNEPCKDKHGCSHTCSRSPMGPRCFCPPDQTLAADHNNCVVVRVQTETVGLIVAGVVGLVLVIVIVLVTLKYRQTKVEFF